jgi:demethylmenaquinone methyltransferase/2-methoxy-6-polyprenyl-1,4-benzoquinol methylase
LVALAKAVGPTGRVIGLDISDGMLGIARERLQKEGLNELVELHLGDAAKLDFIEANSQDGVFMSFTLELFDNPEIPRVLQECHRILKPGGRLAVVSMTKTDPPGIAVRMYEWFHEHMPDYADCRPIFARQALEHSGFTIQNVSVSSMWGLPVEIVLGKKS